MRGDDPQPQQTNAEPERAILSADSPGGGLYTFARQPRRGGYREDKRDGYILTLFELDREAARRHSTTVAAAIGGVLCACFALWMSYAYLFSSGLAILCSSVGCFAGAALGGGFVYFFGEYSKPPHVRRGPTAGPKRFEVCFEEHVRVDGTDVGPLLRIEYVESSKIVLLVARDEEIRIELTTAHDAATLGAALRRTMRERAGKRDDE
jgi:hypothetical protein